MPQAAEQFRVDQFLSEFAISYGNLQSDYVADRISPKVPVAQRSGKIRVWSKANDFRVDQNLAPRRSGDVSSRIDIKMDEQPYSCERYARHVMVPMDDIDDLNGQLDLEMEHTERLTSRMLGLRELRLANSLKTAIVAAGNVIDLSTYNPSTDGLSTGATGAGNAQFDVAGSHPLILLTMVIKAVYAAIGVTVNQAVLPYDIALTLRNHPDYITRFQYWKDTIEDLELANRILGMEPVVARSQQNTAARGYEAETPNVAPLESQDETLTLAPIWGNDIVLLYTPNPSVHRIGKSTLCTTKSLHVPGQSFVKKWFDNDHNSTKVEQQDCITEQVTAPLTGFIIKNVLKVA